MPTGFELFTEQLKSLRRDPSASEASFFKKNPEVSGFASEDGMIVLNPHRKFTDEEEMSLLVNKASRLAIRRAPRSLAFPITQQQQGMFNDFAARGVPGERSGQDIRETILARLVAGDPSAGIPNKPQVTEANRFRTELMRFLGNR